MKKLLLLPIFLVSCVVLTGPQRPADAIPHADAYCEYLNQDVAYCTLDDGSMYTCTYEEMQWSCAKL